MSGPDDQRVGPHPFFGPAAGDTIRACDLPGCGRNIMNAIHHVPAAWPGGNSVRTFAVFEAAKAVARLADEHKIAGASPYTQGTTALTLLEQSLAQAGHPSRPPSLSERAMAEVDRLRREDPAAYEKLVQRLARDVVTQPEHKPASLMADGTSDVLDDYQNRSQ